ncbi:MAG: cation:proton antiporter domain-containing protein, partial [Planctomycetota bacterium]
MSIFDNIIFELALIFAGASILATIFLYLKQPIILAYISLGMLVGPWGIGLFEDPSHIEHVSHLGIILLMFLIGLNLHPQKLF